MIQIIILSFGPIKKIFTIRILHELKIHMKCVATEVC